LGPGLCLRLWTRAQERGRAAHRAPEILQADLAGLVLELALWGMRDPAALKWLHAPPRPAWGQAEALLTRLGALDGAGRLTARGRTMAGLPVHPRLAAMLTGAAPGARGLAADLAALLSERDPMIRQPGQERTVDLHRRLEALAAMRQGGAPAEADRRRLAAAERVSRQLLRLTPRLPESRASSPGALLALAYPDRVAQRRAGPDGRYRLRNGTGAVLPPDDPLGSHAHLVVAELYADGREGRIRLALPVTEDELHGLFAQEASNERVLSWDAKLEAVVARQVARLDALVLAARPVPLEPDDEVAPVLLGAIAGDPARALPWTEDARQLQARVALLAGQDPAGGWPDLSAEHLAATLGEWLSPWLPGKSRLAQLRELDLAAILRARLAWDLQQRLDDEAPTHYRSPAGKRHGIDYAHGGAPAVSVPLQEMLGARETPSVCRGRVRLLLRLLSPARRPIQVTRDLAGFWSGSYAEVRKEMRGRYPKHHWPEDPASAAPMARSTKPRA
jgi:ATP-dependent helicase HrpB